MHNIEFDKTYIILQRGYYRKLTEREDIRRTPPESKVWTLCHIYSFFDEYLFQIDSPRRVASLSGTPCSLD